MSRIWTINFLLVLLIFILNFKAKADQSEQLDHLQRALDEFHNFDIDEPHVQINFSGAYSTRRNFTNEEIALMDDIEFDTAVGSHCDSKLWQKWVGVIYKALECSDNHEYALRKALELEHEIRDEAIYLILGYTGAEIRQIRKTNKHAKIKAKGHKDKAIKFLQSICMTRNNRFLQCSADTNTCACPKITNAWINTENVGGICVGSKCSICDIPESLRAITTTPSTLFAKRPFSGPLHCAEDLICEAAKSDNRRWFCREKPKPTTTMSPTDVSENSTDVNNSTESSADVTITPENSDKKERKKRQADEDSDEDLDDEDDDVEDEDEDDEDNEVLDRQVRSDNEKTPGEETTKEAEITTILIDATTENSFTDTTTVNDTTVNETSTINSTAELNELNLLEDDTDTNETDGEPGSTTEPPDEECPMQIVISKIPCYFSGKMPDTKKNGGNVVYTGYLWLFSSFMGVLANYKV